MTDRKTLYDGISHAAWGYLFLYLDINLGTVSVLPRFVGWLMFLSAIEKRCCGPWASCWRRGALPAGWPPGWERR